MSRPSSRCRFFERRPWGRGDWAALAAWTLVIVAFFFDVVAMRGALFYFDISEINYPYRAFFADELKAGRFSRWCPGIYCGLPLFSESQAGYLHPFKYLLYPWLETWQALNLDTVLSVWLTGVGTYLWLRRHVGPAGALTGAAIFGLSGYTWGHLIHTSMINALPSVPFIVWGLEASWTSGRWRGAVVGGLALACQVFAGHLQDALFSVMLVGLYASFRFVSAPGRAERRGVLPAAFTLVLVGVLVSAVQWIPSKELLDRSPRAGGLDYRELVFGSWHPELLPTLVVREAYGTRARDTGWLNGYYPYHEMNTYVGLIAMVLAVVGAGGPVRRDRWANFWVMLIGLGGILMLGKFTFLFDRAPQIPILGSSREPVRFHIWVALGVAALAAVGVERLGRPVAVSLRGGLILAGVLVVLSIPIAIGIYHPVWTAPRRWTEPYHIDRYRWLGRELAIAVVRTAVIAALGWWVARKAAGSDDPGHRRRWAACLPLLVMADLLGAHWYDVVTVTPRYWTEPPVTATKVRSDPTLIRVFGIADKASGEPGYASEAIDFLSVRDALDWSLPPVWHLATSKGVTPMYSRRLFEFGDPLGTSRSFPWRFDLEGVTHFLTGIHKPESRAKYVDLVNRRLFPDGQPRARIVGRPAYAADERQALSLFQASNPDVLRERAIVEDPSRPLPSASPATGKAVIVEDLPDRIVVEADLDSPGYLVLSDTYEPGWKATANGQPVTVRPANLAFRAVYLATGHHTVRFDYEGAAIIRRNPEALPRARIMGRPVYAPDARQARELLVELGNQNRLRDHLIVEDPTRPLPPSATPKGTAQIVEDLPERVVIEAELDSPGYLLLADTYDPGWTATDDGRPAPIRPAYLAFRAVYLTAGRHAVVFTYRPAGFAAGLWLSGQGLLLGLVLSLMPGRPFPPDPDHVVLGWPTWWRTAWFLLLAAIVLASTLSIRPGGRLEVNQRWWRSVHSFTWGAGRAAMKENRR